jgi:hypothetical protein
VRVETKFEQYLIEIMGRWSARPLELPEMTPRLGHVSEWVVVGYFNDNTSARVSIESTDEGLDVTHVVGDVVSGHDVTTGYVVRHLGPETFEGLDVEMTHRSIALEHGEHLGLMIDTDH